MTCPELSGAAQVRSLLSLFVDIEHTDRSNTFYEKFRTRSLIGEILGEPRPHRPVCEACLDALPE